MNQRLNAEISAIKSHVPFAKVWRPPKEKSANLTVGARIAKSRNAHVGPIEVDSSSSDSDEEDHDEEDEETLRLYWFNVRDIRDANQEIEKKLFHISRFEEPTRVVIPDFETDLDPDRVAAFTKAVVGQRIAPRLPVKRDPIVEKAVASVLTHNSFAYLYHLFSGIRQFFTEWVQQEQNCAWIRRGEYNNEEWPHNLFFCLKKLRDETAQRIQEDRMGEVEFATSDGDMCRVTLERYDRNSKKPEIIATYTLPARAILPKSLQTKENEGKSYSW